MTRGHQGDDTEVVTLWGLLSTLEIPAMSPWKLSLRTLEEIMKSKWGRRLIIALASIAMLSLHITTPYAQLDAWATGFQQSDPPVLLFRDEQTVYSIRQDGTEFAIVGPVARSPIPGNMLISGKGTVSSPADSPLPVTVSADSFFERGMLSPDGQKLVYTELPLMEGQYNVWLLDRNGRISFPVQTDSEVIQGQLVPVAWTEEAIYFDTILGYVPGTHFGIWRYDLGTQDMMKLAIPGINYYDAVLLSPDGSNLVFSAQKDSVCDRQANLNGSDSGSSVMTLDLQSLQTREIMGGVPANPMLLGWVVSSQITETKRYLEASAASPLTASYLYWPLPDAFRDIVCYPGCYSGHIGTDVDVAGDETTPLYAAAAGTVVALCYTEPSGYYRNTASCNGAGNFVRLQHDTNGQYTMYYHMKQNSVTVTVGNHVSTGQLLGYASNSGYTCGTESAATGCMGYAGSYYHLHFEVWDTCGTKNCWLNPGTPIFGSGTHPPCHPAAAVAAHWQQARQALCQPRRHARRPRQLQSPAERHSVGRRSRLNRLSPPRHRMSRRR